MLDRSLSRSSRSSTPVLPPLISTNKSPKRSSFSSQQQRTSRPSSGLLKTIKQHDHNNHQTYEQYEHDTTYSQLDATLNQTLDASIERSIQQQSMNSLTQLHEIDDTLLNRSHPVRSSNSNRSFNELCDDVSIRLQNDWHCISSPHHQHKDDSINPTLECLQWLTQLVDMNDQAAADYLIVHPHIDRIAQLLNQALLTSNGIRSKQARNQLVALIGRLMQYDNARSAFLLTSVVHDLLQHALFISSNDSLSTRFTQTSDTCDIELRHLIWTIIACLSNDWIALSMIAESGVIDCLLNFIDAAAQCNEVEAVKHMNTSISSYQLACHYPFSALLDLQSTALLTLATLSEHSFLLLHPRTSKTDQQSSEHSLGRLCRFIDHIEFNPLNRKDKQLAATQCRQLKQAALRTVALVCASLYAEPSHASVKPVTSHIANELTASPHVFSPVFRTLTAVIAEAVEHNNAMLSIEANSTEARCHALMAVTFLSQDSSTNETISREHRTVHLVCQLINQYGQQSSSYPSPVFIFGLVDHVVRAVLPDKRSCEILHAFDGVAGLMQLLCVCINASMLSPLLQAAEWKRVQVHILRALVTLIHITPDIFDTLILWRSQPALQSLFHLLIRVWTFDSYIDPEDYRHLEGARYNISVLISLLQVDQIVQALSNVLEPEELTLLIEMSVWNNTQHLRQWSLFREDIMQSIEVAPEDEARVMHQIESFSAAAGQFADLTDACNSHRSTISSEALSAYLGTVNERRIEQQSSIIEKLGTGCFRTKYGAAGKKQHKQAAPVVLSDEMRSRPTTTIKKYNSSVYGKFRKVEPFVVGNETKEEVELGV